MAINPDIRDQAYQFFIEEAPELLQAIEAGLLTLKHDRSTTKVHNLMRAAHSIKGGAASVGLEAVTALAHRLENIFKALYSDSLDLDVDLENQLLQAYDCLRLPLMEQITTGFLDAGQALAIAEPVFTRIEQRCGDALTQGDSYIPTSAELGIDMVSSILEVDVAQGLQHLATIIEHPTAYEVAGELRAQIEVFAGFAELLNLREFGNIAETTQRALTANPDRALEIAQLALTDFERSRQALLAGDRTQAIGPSIALVRLTGAASPVAPLASFVAEPAIAPEPIAAEPIAAESIAAEPADMLDFALPQLESIFGSFEMPLETIGLDTIVPEPKPEPIAADGAALPFEEPEPLIAAIAPPVILEADVQAIEALFDHPPLLQDQTVPLEQVTETMADASPAGSLVPSGYMGGALQLRAAIDSPQPPPQKLNQEPTYVYQVEPATPNLTVRVDAERLERMNNLVGELAINRDGLSLQNEQLQRSLREILSRFSRFQNRVNNLRELSDQTLVAPERYRYGAESTSDQNGTVGSRTTIGGTSIAAAPTFPAPAAFDPLEMDSYGELHARLQEILEDIVQLEETVDDITLFSKQSNQILEQQRRMLSHLGDEVVWARMLPLGEILNRFPRVLRDLSTAYHKPVSLKLTGTGVLVEKAILEKLYDPLLHLLRNAFDHGIEPPHLRQQQGKPEQGQIEIRAYHKGNQTVIEVKDDGQGLSLDRIRQRALELGWLSVEQLHKLSPVQLREFIFEPGFSTARQVSELSGRGIGLDVVRSQLRSIKGTVTVSFTPGQGTTFTLYLPLNLSIAKLVVCIFGSASLALQTDSVEEILIPQDQQIRQSGTQRFLLWREQIIPVYRLADLVRYNCPITETTISRTLESISSPKATAMPMLILREEQQIFALEVDRLVPEQELVVKPFNATIAPPGYIYGCTVLGDGSLVPVINGTALVALSTAQGSTATPTARDSETATRRSSGHIPIAIRTVQAPTVLVIDDSATLRRTLAVSLERIGYRVLQARDGREAIEQLQQRTTVQLIVCDVEMPNMNGLEFLSHRRQHEQLATIPIVMLTSRSNNKHRWLATQLGATAYFTKPYLEQEFLAALKTIIANG